MLKTAFNALVRMNSRVAQLKRLGTPDIYSPCRIAASNYFRFLRGPSSTTIRGREFIIPVDTALGQFAQTITFSAVPVSGTFKITWNSLHTDPLNYDVTASQIQTELRQTTGLEQILVTGNFTSGFQFVFAGFSTSPSVLSITSNSLETITPTAITATVVNSYSIWSDQIRRGDKLIDTTYGLMAIDEIVEMTDVGGAVMGWRIRCE